MKKPPKPDPESEPVEITIPEATASEAAEPETLVIEPPAEAGAPSPVEEAREAFLKKLQADCEELRERLIRRQADFENFRKRTERDVAELKQLAAADLTEALLPILDSFERALSAEGGSSIEDYQKGFELIYKQFYDTLMRFGLTPVKSAGRPFDPHYHHAVERVETTAHQDNTVLDELQRGYTFKHKLLRPAMVRVAVQPEPPAEQGGAPAPDEGKPED